MSGRLQVWVEGIGCWSPGLVDWPAWRAVLRGEGAIDATAPTKPNPARLAAGERRRASIHVLAAIEVADQAVAMSGRDGADLACVFASAYGDTGIMDYLCATLATAPQHLSPTRFHNSVHNAAAGYWTIASGDHAASQAVAAGEATFGAALLEAAVQAATERRPVLLVAHDEPGSGPLAEVFAVARPFACALLLAPEPGPSAVARLGLSLGLSLGTGGTHADTPGAAHVVALTEHNPAACGLALLEALTAPTPRRVVLAAAPALAIDVEMAS